MHHCQVGKALKALSASCVEVAHLDGLERSESEVAVAR